MSLKKIAVAMLGAAEALAENDDMQDDIIFSQASQDTFNKATEFMKKAEPLLGEYESCYRAVLNNLNEDKDGGMFLCAEAKPDYDRAMELSVEIGALMREYGYAGT